MQIKLYSSHSSSPNPLFSPEIKYANADLDKLQIFKENKGKAGVYR